MLIPWLITRLRPLAGLLQVGTAGVSKVIGWAVSRLVGAVISVC